MGGRVEEERSRAPHVALRQAGNPRRDGAPDAPFVVGTDNLCRSKAGTICFTVLPLCADEAMSQ